MALTRYSVNSVLVAATTVIKMRRSLYRIRRNKPMALSVLFFILALTVDPLAGQRKMNSHDPAAPAEEGGFTIGRFHFAASYGRLIGHPDWYFCSPWHYWGAYPFGYPLVNPPPLSGLPGWASGIDIQSGMGEVGLSSNVEHADVFIDGSYAGKVGDLSTLLLEPGPYELEVLSDAHEPFRMRIFVLLGKNLEIEALLKPLDHSP
jgi:hypothetical protein